MSSSHSSSKQYNTESFHYRLVDGMAVSASVMGSVLVVGGMCWLFYCICHSSHLKPRNKGNNWKPRKTSVTSVSANATVPGDEHGQYYTGSRDSRIYMDTQTSGFATSATTPNRLMSSLSAYPTSFVNYPYAPPGSAILHMVHSQCQMDNPPPYPGESEKGASQQHTPVKMAMPPPYSA